MNASGSQSASPSSRVRLYLAVLAVVVVAAAVITVAAPRLLGTPGGPGVPPDDGELALRPSGEDAPISSPISIAFGRPVPHDTIEKGFTLTPATEGALAWQGNTLVFRAAYPGLARGTAYKVSVALPPDVASAIGAGSNPITYSFVTEGKLAVASTSPETGSADVAFDAPLMVSFSRPVAALTALTKAATPLLTFDPPAEGEGRWLTSTIYRFVPTTGWQPATTYRVTVPKSVSDTLGGQLPDDATWSFATAGPGVVDTSPRDNAQFMGPQGEIKVMFNLPVDRAAAQMAFSLNPPVEGSFAWPDDKTLVFRPSRSYQPSTRYSASAAVSPTSSKLTSWSFTTVGAPALVRTMPAAGAVTENRPVNLVFAHPMDRDSVEAAISISPAPRDRPQPGWNEDNTEVYIFIPDIKPSTAYTVTLAAGAKDRFGQALAQAMTLPFTTAPLPPQATVLRSGPVGAYDADGPLLAPLRIVNTTGVDLQLYQLDRARFATLTGKDPDSLSSATPLRSWTYAPKLTQQNVTAIEGVPLADAQGQKLPPGYYALRVIPSAAKDTPPNRGGPPWDVLPFIVSRAHLVVKQADQQALVWAVDVGTGQPLAGLPVTLYDRDGTTKLAEGQTESNGVLRAAIPAQPPVTSGRPRNEMVVLAEALRDGAPALASSNWTGTAAPWQFGLATQYTRQGLTALAYTDRPIYRPGHTVEVKGIVRNDNDGRFSHPGGGFTATLLVNDPQGRVVQETPVGAGGAALTDAGSLAVQVPLGDEAATGQYALVLAVGDERTYLGGFLVAEYRAPEFAVEAMPQAKEAIAGDDLAVKVKAGYYFGATVPDAALRWRVTGRPYDFTLPDDPGWSFDDRDPDPDRLDILRAGDTRASGAGRTAGDGTASFSFAADLSRDVTSQVFTAEATVTDPGNNQEVAARAEVVVHRGAFYLGLRPRSYLAEVDKPVAVDLLAIGTDRKPAPGTPATVTIFRRVWNSVREQDPDGSTRYISRAEDTQVATQSATADSEGRAVATFIPAEGGLYRFVATGRDARGNNVRSAVSVWATGGGAYVPWRIEDHDRMELVLDKREYQPGDIARVLVPSPFADATALVTVERGSIISQRVVKLTGNSAAIELPVTDDLLPNAYVSVAVIRGAANPAGDRFTSVYRVGYGTLNVAISGKRLQVKAEPDRAQLGPGETVTYTVTTADNAGTPAAAEVSLALVDSAVLALTDEATPKPLDTFYRKRPLGVSTGSSAALSADRFLDSLGIGRSSAQGKGGGGGNNGDRSDFKATAYWNATVRTDASGRATVSIPLPDNLTTWRMTAVAVTPDTRFGTATSEVVTSKSLLVRPALPRFLIAGDEAVIEATVHNGGGSAVNASVTLAADGLTVTGGAQQTPVAAGGDAIVRWTVKAPLTAQSALVKVTAQAGELRDGVELPLAVQAASVPEVMATAGMVQDAVDEIVLAPGYVDASRGELRVQVTPSLAAAVQAAASTLREQPWEVDCTETTVSRMLPRLAMARAYTKLGVSDPDGMGKELPDIIARAVQRLYKAQGFDGGWGWCAGDVSEPLMTAYAVIGLAEAKADGHAVDPGALGRAAGYLRGYLDRPDSAVTPNDPNVQALALYALAAAEQGDLSRMNLLAERRATLGNDGKALLAVALHRQPPGASSPALQSVINDLTAAAVVSATGAHWEEDRASRGRTASMLSTTVRSTALALHALARVRPDHTLIDNGVRWLLAARKAEGRAWATLPETAWSLVALTDVLAAKGDTQAAAGAGYLVRLNGRDLAEGRADTNRTLTPDEYTVPMKDLPLDFDNHVGIARSQGAGGGQLYYTMHLRYFPPAGLVEAVNRGIGVARDYTLAMLGGSGKQEAGRGTGTGVTPASQFPLPISSVKAGEVVRATVTVVAPSDLNFVRVEDFVPAGLEPLDASLKTTSREFADQLRQEQQQGRGKGAVMGEPPVFTRSLWSRAEVRDDRVVLMARYLPKGVHTYTYFLRATRPGTYQVPPVQAQLTDFPEVWGRSDGGTFRVEEGR